MHGFSIILIFYYGKKIKTLQITLIDENWNPNDQNNNSYINWTFPHLLIKLIRQLKFKCNISSYKCNFPPQHKFYPINSKRNLH